ncbi:MAG: hypothetical protein H5U40_08235 [Polyangiaceae bacterium]|nr:hypothetical protein [Polyangiaceae bacterium]
MSPLTLVLATPLFGLSLTLDPSFAASPVVFSQALPFTADIDPESAAEQAEPQPDVATLMAQRARFGRIHQWMGIATWASMTATVALGWVQYANLYGHFADREDTRCVQGDPFFERGPRDPCVGQPLPHLISSATTGVLYYTTFALSYYLPDPLGLDEGNSRSARALRQHKRLRWAHLSGMAIQILLGVFTANSDRFGLDRTNDYRALQALATVHLVTGLATYATLTWAGTIMIF